MRARPLLLGLVLLLAVPTWAHAQRWGGGGHRGFSGRSHDGFRDGFRGGFHHGFRPGGAFLPFGFFPVGVPVAVPLQSGLVASRSIGSGWDRGIGAGDVGVGYRITDVNVISRPTTFGVTTNIATTNYIVPGGAGAPIVTFSDRTIRQIDRGTGTSQITDVVYGPGGATFRTVTRHGDGRVPERPRRHR